MGRVWDPRSITITCSCLLTTVPAVTPRDARPAVALFLGPAPHSFPSSTQAPRGREVARIWKALFGRRLQTPASMRLLDVQSPPPPHQLFNLFSYPCQRLCRGRRRMCDPRSGFKPGLESRANLRIASPSACFLPPPLGDPVLWLAVIYPQCLEARGTQLASANTC